MRSFLRQIGPIAALAWMCHAEAIEIQTQTIDLGHDQNIVFMPFVNEGESEPMLLVIETPDLDEREIQTMGLAEPIRTISLYRQSESGWELHLRTKLDASMDILDTVRQRGGIALAGYRKSQVHLLQQQTSTFEPLLTASSMYVGSTWDTLPSVEMFRDLNGDDLDDFLMPDFDGWQVALQRESGFDLPQTIGPGPRMNFGDGMEMVGFLPETPYFFDANLDGLSDLAFWVNGQFEVYRQVPSGLFSENAETLDPGMKDVLGSFFSVEIGDGDDEADQPQRLLEAVTDVDGDGMADLVIQTMEGDGIFGIETSYQIHRGVISSDGLLSFEKAPSSTLESDGIQLENERLDLTGDGQQEFLVTSVDITLGAIISALITRSASVDVAVHQLSNGVFSGEPRLTKKIKVRFDFSEGDLFIPAVLSADITGDGRQDLLVQRDEEMLLVYPGEATERLFSKQPIRLTLSLPKDRESFVVTDLDGDGRDELIVHLEQDEQSVLSVITFDVIAI
jgi:hypothetical protein